MRFEINNISKRSDQIGKKIRKVKSSFWLQELSSGIGNFGKDFNMHPKIDNKNVRKLNKKYTRHQYWEGME